MKNSFKKSIMFMMLLLALTFSALGVTPVLADDGVTPPADAPVVEEPVADVPVADAPVVDASTVEQPAVNVPVVAESAAEEVTVSEVLEQLPEDTALVVLDESGETLPLVSAEATEVLAAPDPYFTVGGTIYRFFDSGGDCSAYNEGVDCFISAGDTPIQDAVNYLVGLNAAPDDGYIYVEGGTYAENVIINGKKGKLANLSGLIGAGSDTTTINGSFYAYSLANAFTLSGFTFNDWVEVDTADDVAISDVMVDGSYIIVYSGGNVELNGVTVSQSPSEVGAYISTDGDISIWNSHFDDNAYYGLDASSDSGNILLDGVTTNGNGGNGAYVYTSDGDITIWDSAFNDNEYDGLNAYSNSGNIMLDGVIADGNGDDGTSLEADGDISVFDSAFNNNYRGLYARSYSGNVTLDGVTASGNSDTGAYLDADASMVEVFCSDFSDNDLGLQGGKSGPDLYLNGVTFSGNASGDYENPSGNVWVSGHDCGASVAAPAHNDGEKKDQTPASLYVVIEQTQGQLPADLGDGFKFGSALKVGLTEEGKDVTDLAMTLSFPIPAGMKDSSLVVMFWNGSAWVEVSGGSVVDGFYVITVDQPGDYVLVAK